MFGKTSWEARFRAAHFKKDVPEALKIALDRLMRGDAKDAEYLLSVQSWTAERDDPAWASYFREVMAKVAERFPQSPTLRANAASDLSAALRFGPEAVELAEEAYETWGQAGTRLDSVDPWPKVEPGAKRARRRLAKLYRRIGRFEDADRVFPLVPCRHLEPLAAELRARGVEMKPVVANEELSMVVDVVLDVGALAKRLALPREVQTIDYFDPRSYQDLGFKCTAHLIWLLGEHPNALPKEDPRRERANWFR